MAEKTTAQKEKNRRGLLIGVIIVAIAALVLVIALLTRPSADNPQAENNPTTSSGENTKENSANNPSDSSAPQEVSPQAKAIIDEAQRRDANDKRAKGKVDAPVVVSIFADFRCGHCADFTLSVEPQLQSLIDEGKIRYEFNNFPILGDESRLAAQAAQAAAIQNKFWEYHDALFKGAKQNSIQYNVDGLTELAKKIGVKDLEKFRTDMTSPETTDFVNTEIARGRDSIGLQGVPALFVGYTYIPGGIDFQQLSTILRSELQRK